MPTAAEDDPIQATQRQLAAEGQVFRRGWHLALPVTRCSLWRIAAIVHEADLDDERYDAPEAPGLDVALRGLSTTGTDTLTHTGPLFDGLAEFYRRATLLGREPA